MPIRPLDFFTDGQRLYEVVHVSESSPYLTLRNTVNGLTLPVSRDELKRSYRAVTPASSREMFGCADPLASAS